jgi:1,4-alpha-glucan branching enzyme
MADINAGKQKVTFSFYAPEAKAVLLAAEFTDWQKAPLSFKKDKKGLWKKTVSLAPGRYQYRLLVDGQWHDDPQCKDRQINEFGTENCVVVVKAPGTPAA